MITEHTLSSAGNAEIEAEQEPTKSHSQSHKQRQYCHQAGSGTVLQAKTQHRLRVA